LFYCVQRIALMKR